MTDDRRTIGSGGQAGRGNRSTSPSSAARSLAGTPREKKPVTKAKPANAKATPKDTSGPKSTPKRAAPKKAAGRTTPPAGGRAGGTEAPRLRAVTDEDAAAAAAAAAEEAARQTRTAGPGAMPAGIPLDEIVVAIAQAAQRVLGSDWEGRLAAFVAALRKRLSGDFAVDEFGFDPQIAEVLSGAVEPLAEKWFRLEVRGIENIPAEGGALLVANHSGTVPIDGVITGYAVKKYSGRNIRPLGADLVFAMPFIGQFARKVGATLACTADAERLLTSGELAAVWPEGFKGIGKPFAERYKLQRFGRGGFVSSAMRAQVPIVPVSIVGAEEIYPLVGNVPSLARLLGLPYLPITPFFPLLGPLGMIPLPSKWIIEFGEPIRTDAYEPEAADDPMLLFNVTDQVRETIQQTLYALLVDRGNAFF
jgi:1-acyl-sn-glycerol-3-phosphate acyltransferase